MIAIIDKRMPKKAKAKLSEHFKIIELPPSQHLDTRVASHPDMLMFYLNGKLFINRDYLSATGNLLRIKGVEIIECDGSLSHDYPNDIAFNCFVSNNALFGNTRHTANEIISFANKCGLEQKPVKQGYAKCSTVVLGDDGIITADQTIYKAYTENSGNALLISPSGIALDGYDCGFIGGASGVYNKEIFFCGDVSLHPDYEMILDFTKRLGYKITSLSDEPLYDVGTIFFI